MAKLKPILFNTAMVQKIMAGEKTETRRVVLPQPEGARFVLDCDEENQTFDLMCGNNGAGGIFCDWAETVKPKFWFGDVLYIRETWRVQSAHRFEADAKIEFRAGGPLWQRRLPADGRGCCKGKLPRIRRQSGRHHHDNGRPAGHGGGVERSKTWTKRN